MKKWTAIIIAYSSLLNANLIYAGESDRTYQFIYDTGDEYNKALLCEKYIKTYSSWFRSQTKMVVSKYKAKDLINASNYIKGDKFAKFKASLWDCSLYVKYIGDTNYFRSANTDLFELISYIELAEETGVYRISEVGSIETSLSNNLNMIENSKRESNR